MTLSRWTTTVALILITGILTSGCDRRARVDDLKPIKAQLEQINHKVNQCLARTG